MAYTLPDDLSSVEDLQGELDKAISAGKSLVKIPDEKMTPEQVTELEALGAAATAIKDEQAKRATAADAQTARVTAAKAALGTLDPDDAEAPAGDPANGPAGDDEPTPTDAETDDPNTDAAPVPLTPPDPGAVMPAAAASGAPNSPGSAPGPQSPMSAPSPTDGDPMMDPAADPTADGTDPADEEDPTKKKEKEPVTASAASSTQSAAERARENAEEVEAPAENLRPVATIIASANLSSFTAGQELSVTDAAEAWSSKARSFGAPSIGAQPVSQRHSVAQYRKGVTEEFALKRGDQNGNASKVTAAAADYKKRLIEAGSDPKALVAAGGWCAPSETLYDIPSLEEISGILNLPEVTIEHGGVSFTKGPDFADIYNDSGFLQTEAQAEAATVKNFIDVECPGFTEVRMDAIGFGVRAGILTEVGWPELVQRYLDGTRVAHAHKVNAYKINKIVAAATASSPNGAAVTAGALGAAVADSLGALEMQAVRLRYKYRMAEMTPIEGFAPIWFLSVLRADLAYREGIDDVLAITDAQVNAWLNARHISLQWVYDYLDLAEAGTTWPTSVSIPLYPVGTFVAGTTDVLSLDAVYDTAGLSINTYTAAFYEEGVMVFNPVANGVLVRIPLTIAGRVGAHDITATVPTLS